MKSPAFALLAVLALPLAAKAEVVDADANGVYTVDEIIAVYPALTKDAFRTADANADGAIDPDEMRRAQKLGVIAK